LSVEGLSVRNTFTGNGQGFLLCWNSLNVLPEPMMNKKLKMKITIKSQIEFGQAGTKIHRCKQPKFQRPAQIAPIPMQ
jgi:hypothetical protein